MARVLGILLVTLGAAGLGWQGLAYDSTERDGEGLGEKQPTIWIPPVASGIAVVSGLIVLASGGRREEF